MRRAAPIVGPMAESSPDDLRERLRAFMESRKLNPKRWAERADVSPNSIYNFLNGHSTKLSPETYAKLAKVEGVPSFVLDGTAEIVRVEAVVIVKGKVQAGVWAEAHEWDEREHFGVSVNVPQRFEGRAFGLVVEGRSMDLLYREGTVAVVLPLHDLDRDLRDGDRVVVRRIRADGMAEATIKELVIDESGAAWLWPRSSDPRFQQPIELSNGHDRTETVEVIAVVIRAIQPEPNFP